MKKLVIIIFALMFGTAFLQAQEADSSSFGFFEDEYLEKDTIHPSGDKQGLKPHYHLSLGSSFGHISGIGNFTGFYAAPTVSFPVNNRLSFHGGLIASVSYQPGFMIPGENAETYGFTSLSLYGSATYRLSENLTVFGTGIKSLTEPPAFLPYYPSDRITIGSSLKLGEHITIGASFSTSDRYQPFGPYSPGFGNPFSRGPIAW